MVVAIDIAASVSIIAIIAGIILQCRRRLRRLPHEGRKKANCKMMRKGCEGTQRQEEEILYGYRGVRERRGG